MHSRGAVCRSNVALTKAVTLTAKCEKGLMAYTHCTGPGLGQGQGPGWA